MIENEVNIDNKFTMKVHFNLRNKKSPKSQIWLTTTINGKRANVYTGQKIEDKYWLKTSRTEIGERVKESDDFGKVQNKINKEINKELRKILGYCQEYGREVSRNGLDVEPLPHTKENFEFFISQKIRGQEVKMKKDPESFILSYIERKMKMTNKATGKTINGGTIYNHNNALTRLKQYCDSKRLGLVWELFDTRFEESFTAWMNEKNYAPNTISSQYSIIKVWLTEAEKEGLIHDNAFHSYTTKTYDVENIYLTETEIKRIYDIDFNKDDVKNLIDPKSKIEETRDLFIIACWTGLRYGDWKDLSSKANFENDDLIITTSKTNKPVTIPLHPYVKAILKKYNGKLPHAVDKTRSLAHIRKCGEIAGINQETIKNIIRGGRNTTIRQPKYSFIGNHTARRCFATNMYLKGVPVVSIMAITGHKTEENFFKYIKLSPKEHANIVRKGFEE